MNHTKIVATIGPTSRSAEMLRRFVDQGVDVIRFNPDQSELRVGYIVRGVTATQDQDYFEPRSTTVTFGPGQRSARILIPLVQDSEIEDDEALMLELIVSGDNAESDLFRRIAVMIRDDDTPGH